VHGALPALKSLRLHCGRTHGVLLELASALIGGTSPSPGIELISQLRRQGLLKLKFNDCDIDADGVLALADRDAFPH